MESLDRCVALPSGRRILINSSVIAPSCAHYTIDGVMRADGERVGPVFDAYVVGLGDGGIQFVQLFPCRGELPPSTFCTTGEMGDFVSHEKALALAVEDYLRKHAPALRRLMTRTTTTAEDAPRSREAL